MVRQRSEIETMILLTAATAAAAIQQQPCLLQQESQQLLYHSRSSSSSNNHSAADTSDSDSPQLSTCANANPFLAQCNLWNRLDGVTVSFSDIITLHILTYDTMVIDLSPQIWLQRPAATAANNADSCSWLFHRVA